MSPTPDPIRILCLNAWGGTLGDALLAYLRTGAPDVLCLQEVIHSPATNVPVLTYRDGAHVLPQRPNLHSEVAACLPGYQATFCPAARGTLWDDEVEISSFWGIATYVHPRLKVIGQAQGFVHKDYSPQGYGDHPRSRPAHAVRLHDGCRGLSVTHMHGLRDLAGKQDTPDRAAQAERLLALSRAVAAPGELAVICGDFNVGPESATLALLARAGFTELVTAQGHPGTRTEAYPKPGKFADYMAVSDPAAVRGFEVVRTPEVSDHCPLLLTV
jgi:endonuclease/exonuclease/phosphatase family metal-dependent hydrolase